MKTLAEIMARMAEINARMAAIRTESRAQGVATEKLEQLDAEADALSKERAELTQKAIELRTEPTEFAPVVGGGEAEKRGKASPFGTLEYRQAFMDFIMRGTRGEAIERAVAKARDEGFVQDDAKSVIVPTTITDLLYIERGQAGSIFSRVHKSNYAAGMAIPTINFSPKLEWVAENKVATKQKGTTGSITFNGYKAQIRVAVSLETQIKTLAQFEACILEAIRVGIDEGLDEVIINGDGTGKPTGILTGADYENKAVTVNKTDIRSYLKWLEIWAKVPLKGRRGCQLHINKCDWEAYLHGMTDGNGKIIATESTGIDGNLIYRLFGREVVILEDQGLPTFDSVEGAAEASKSTAFAYFFDDSKYYFNSNMQLQMRQYIDEDTDETVHKATLIADGKVVKDTSLLVICRGEDA